MAIEQRGRRRRLYSVVRPSDSVEPGFSSADRPAGAVDSLEIRIRTRYTYRRDAEQDHLCEGDGFAIAGASAGTIGRQRIIDVRRVLARASSETDSGGK